MKRLIDKYNVPGPRYTSYPTVPYWDVPPSEDEWKALVKESFQLCNDNEGISIYIHLPYCESLCTFCGCTTRITVNHAVEEPYINALLSEWKLYTDLFEQKPRVKEIHLGGGTPTFFSPQNLQRLIEEIKETAEMEESVSMSLEANPNSTTHEHLQVLYKMGFDRLSLGIQDFDPVVQKAINRLQSFTQVKCVTDWARQIGYRSINYDLVYGLPYQTEASIETTIDLVNLLRPDRIAYYSYAHVPWVKPGQRSFTEKDLPEVTLKHEMYVQGKEMLTNVGYIEIGMDHFALPDDELTQAFRRGEIHRNFMGYTTQPSKLMVGLGVSAIGDTWTGFAQNVKTVELYLDKIAKKRFPIFRGHVLTEEDLMFRQLILEIMCHFKADFHGIDHSKLVDNLRILDEMKQDQLVVIDNDSLQVTREGRAYVRNICMAFDKRLIRNIPETQVFSMTV